MPNTCIKISSYDKIIISIDRITDKKKEWLDHMQGMDSYRLARKAVEYKPIGHRDIRRPKSRWEDDF
jgi:hypothetical protein